MARRTEKREQKDEMRRSTRGEGYGCGRKREGVKKRKRKG